MRQSVPCIGGPLDGRTVITNGENPYYHGEFPPIDAETMADPKTGREVSVLMHAYRLREYRYDAAEVKDFRYVHESVSDEEAMNRVKRAWGLG